MSDAREDPFKAPPGERDLKPSPFARTATPAEVESPRLRIIHLLTWMALAAGYITAIRFLNGINDRTGQGGSDLRLALLGLQGIGGSAALGMLILWPSQRLRGVRFPYYPGEWLWLLVGCSTLFSLLMQVFPAVLFVWDRETGSNVDWTYYRFAWGTGNLLLASLSLLPVLLISQTRWRLVFIAAAGAHLFNVANFFILSWLQIGTGAPLVKLANFFILSWLQFGIGMASTLFLAIVVAMDMAGHRRYPWSHWAGVAIRFWITGLTAFRIIGIWLRH